MTDSEQNVGHEPVKESPAESAISPAGAGGPEKSGWRLATIIVSVVAVAAIAGLGFVLFSVLQGRTDAETALAVSQERISGLEGDLGDARAEATRFKAQRDGANTQLADARVRADKAEARAGIADELEQGVIDLMGASFALVVSTGPADAACMAESLIGQIGAVAMLERVVETFSNPFAAQALAPETEIAADDCGVTLGGGSPALEVGQTYGDNPTLDALWDQCAAADGAACDTLYSISEVGSDYERFGGTCGDRFATIFDAPLLCEGEV